MMYIMRGQALTGEVALIFFLEFERERLPGVTLPLYKDKIVHVDEIF